jgi:site-specific DNA recombinase
MNAIYARQSVDRADSISIESQIEFCQYEMRGEQYKVYTDRGYSGKNTDRPAFAEMMNDIENGVIGKVVVYKLDRISRSILDFSNMMEQFGTHKVEFVSTTEKFFPDGARHAQYLHRVCAAGTRNHSKARG